MEGGTRERASAGGFRYAVALTEGSEPHRHRSLESQHVGRAIRAICSSDAVMEMMMRSGKRMDERPAALAAFVLVRLLQNSRASLPSDLLTNTTSRSIKS